MEKNSDVCLVCGDTTSIGWHYGTITCEACKKFFLRNSEGYQEELSCIRSNNSCVITVATRTNCAYCRYQKCIQVGMKANEKASTQAVAFKDIPCKVCGDSSSGLHFGAITCEGCKGFYRRSIKESNKFVCIADGKCEINAETRNLCRACRFNRCLEVGMGLKKSKIGRQSNLFKQLLKFTVGSSSASLPVHSDNSIEKKIIVPQVEDSLEPKIRSLINVIYQAYSDTFENNLYIQSDNNVFINGNHVENFQQHQKVFGFFDNYIRKCYNFLFKSSVQFRSLPYFEQTKLLSNAIYPIRLLELATKETKDSNFLNCDNFSLHKIIKIYPIFEEIVPFFKSQFEYIKELNLDAKECALYLALIAFTSLDRNMPLIKQLFGYNLEICQALRSYMKLRRNEDETCEMLIHLKFKLFKFNRRFQTEMYEKLKGLETTGVKFNSPLNLVIKNPFEKIIDNYSIQSSNSIQI